MHFCEKVPCVRLSVCFSGMPAPDPEASCRVVQQKGAGQGNLVLATSCHPFLCANGGNAHTLPLKFHTEKFSSQLM